MATTSTTTTTTTNTISLQFDDFIDLQTRLVLLPYIEDEGKGAIVMSYQDKERQDDPGKDDQTMSSSLPVEGSILIKVGDDEADEDFQTMDFTSILATIRNQPSPILLVLQKVETNDESGAVEEKSSIEEGQSNETTKPAEEDCASNENDDGDVGDQQLLPAVEEEKKDDIHDSAENDEQDGNPSQQRPQIAPQTPSKGERIDVSDSDAVTPKTRTQQNPFSSLKQTPTGSSSPRRNGQPKGIISLMALDDHYHQSSNRSGGDTNSKSSTTSTNTSLSNSMFALSAWGLRMKAQSEKLAADAMASMAIPASSKNNTIDSNSNNKAVVATTVSSLALDGTAMAENKKTTTGTSSSWHCDMYLQSDLGAYFPVPSSAATTTKIGNGKALQVTTSSLLCIRKSATEPLMMGLSSQNSKQDYDYKFQWYHSSSNKTQYRSPHSVSSLYPPQDMNVDLASIDGRSSSHSSHCSKASYASSSIATIDQEWIPLQGATYPTFQPNTTLVGRRLRCVVTVLERRQISSSTSSSPTIAPTASNNSSNDENQNQYHHHRVASHESLLSSSSSVSSASETLAKADENEGVQDADAARIVDRIICELQEPVRADMVLFNGARQAMSRGAKFANLVGRSISSKDDPTNTMSVGKTFRIEVSIARVTKIKAVGEPRMSITVNSVHIYCRSSSDEEYIPLTDRPLLQVSARADPINSRKVDLIFSVLPPPIDDDEKANEDGSYTTSQFLSEFCIPDSCISRALRLELETPNRLTRESLLLALGIANYQGKPALLDDKTVLYRDGTAPARPPLVTATTTNDYAPPSTSSINVPHQSPLSGKVSQDDEDDDSLSTKSDTGGDPLCSDIPASPTCPRVVGVSPITSQPSPSFFSCQSATPEFNTPIQPKQHSISSILRTPSSPRNIDPYQVAEMQKELDYLRSQLTRKDKLITEMQRKVDKSEMTHQNTKQTLTKCQQELKQSRQDCERIQISKRQVERTLTTQEEAIQRLEANHKSNIATLEDRINAHADKIAELEKCNRALQNEKAVLNAAIEARESKLTKMGELQTANERLAQQVAQQKDWERKLLEAEQRYENKCREVEDLTKAKSDFRKELDDALATVDTLKARIHGEQEKTSSNQSELESLRKKNQQLKGERNNYKQKNDSLSKEISRLCRNGRTIRDIEKILADHDALLQEVDLLRIQKRKALEDAHKYRTSYEQSKVAENLLGVEHETRRAVERTAELERLLSEMTDYVHAKEMQLDTMKQVNEALQDEIHNLAKANLRKNEV